MKNYSPHTTILGLLALCAVSVGVAGMLAELIPSDILRTTEKEIRVRVEAAFGTVRIAKGASNKILTANFLQDEEDERRPQVSYHIHDGRGDLRIETKETSKFWKSSRRKNRTEREWRLNFTDALPIDLKLEFGAGECEIDLSGLKISNLALSTGASSVNLTCDTPNTLIADRIEIESGVSKFDARGLGNLNFRKMTFSGGVGAYKLDFGDNLLRDGDLKVEVGFGAVSIIVPKDAGVRVLYDNHIFSSFDLDDCIARVKKGVYESENYKTALTKLNIDVSSGLGSVRVRHR
jgi:hypothetical protein